MVQLLHGSSAGYRYPGPEGANLHHSILNRPKGTGDTPNLIMDLWRPIKRENDVVEATGNNICLLLQQESGG